MEYVKNSHMILQKNIKIEEILNKVKWKICKVFKKILKPVKQVLYNLEGKSQNINFFEIVHCTICVIQ